MMNPLYIHAYCALSPQNTFDAEAFGNEVNSADNGQLYIVDTDYRQFINPVAIRRMSRQLKAGISTGIRCLQMAGVQIPDAIITGTGLGSMTDTERFLTDMIELKEQALNPTYFIQSTYNSVNGWIALQTKSTGYNQTYVHRGFSLEMSLLDAQLLADEATEDMNVLVGCFDELTPDYFKIKNKIGYWKKDIPDSLQLLKHNDTSGTIAGEGAAFFTCSNKAEDSVCALQSIKMLQEPSDDEINDAIKTVLSENGLTVTDIDVAVLGMNGDSRHQHIYNNVASMLSENTTIAAFKHLCGEYPTATGFGLWLAAYCCDKQHVPETTIYKKGKTNSIKNILLVNHYILNSVSIMLLKTA